MAKLATPASEPSEEDPRRDVHRREPHEVAALLIKLYWRPFGGKPKGKYRFGQRVLLKLANRKALRRAFVAELKAELLEREFVLLDLRDSNAKSGFALLSIWFVNNLRPLAPRIELPTE